VTPLFVVLALVVVGAVAVVAGGRGGGLSAPTSDQPGPWLPTDRAVTADDVDDVHFGVGFRGYRMDEVDLVLDRLGAEIRERDARLARLEGRSGGRLAGPQPASDATSGTASEQDVPQVAETSPAAVDAPSPHARPPEWRAPDA
jgi:DivIVA domain-containing protein